MRNHLALLPGWGFSVDVLEPLRQALLARNPHWHISVHRLPEVPAEHWLAALEQDVPADAWLLGWSLGGQLAQALAAQRGERCPGVISLAASPSFVARADWPHGMPPATLQAFTEGLSQAPQATLKRFGLLCSQGAAEPRALARALQSHVVTECAALPAGLAHLAALDNRAALASYLGPQLYVLAGNDALVPAEVAADLLAILPDVEVQLIEDLSHALLLEQPELLAELVDVFVHEAADV